MKNILFCTICMLLNFSVLAQTPDATTSTFPQDEPLTLEGSLKLRDPFKRPELKIADDRADGGMIPELERYSVEQMRLVGVIVGTKKSKAMIVTPDNKMHIANEQTRIGDRKGIIKSIRKGQVIVEEKIVNILGKEEKIESKLEFVSKNGEKL